MEDFLGRLLFTAFGGAMVALSLREIRQVLNLRTKGREAEGTVVEFLEREGADDSGRDAVVSFTTSTGRSVTFTDPGSVYGMFSGMSVPVRYDPERPEQARVDGLWRMFSRPIFRFLFGLVWLLLNLFGTFVAGSRLSAGGH